MPIVIDQPTLGHGMTDTVTVCSFTTTQPVAPGGFIVALVSWFTGANAGAVITGGGLTWTIDKFEGTGNKWATIASAQAPAGLPSGTTLTATLNATSQDILFTAMSFTGVATSSPVDGTPTVITESTVTAWSTPSYAIQAGSVIVASCFNTTTGTNTPTSPSIEGDDFTDGFDSFVTQYRIESSAGSYTVAGTWSAAGVPNENISVAYLAAVAYAAPPPILIDQEFPGTHQWRGLSNEYWRDIALGGELLMPTAQIRKRFINYREINEIAYFAPYDVSTTIDYLESATVYVVLQVSDVQAADLVDSNTVYVDLQGSGTELREEFDTATVPLLFTAGGTEFVAHEILDSASVLVDLQSSGTELQEFVETATAYVDLQTSGTDAADFSDSATSYVDLQASGVDITLFVDADSPYVDLQASGAELREVTDTATAYVDIQAASVELAEFVDSATPYVDLQASGIELRELTDAATVPVGFLISAVDVLDVTETAEVYFDLRASGVDVYEPLAVLAAYVIMPPYIV